MDKKQGRPSTRRNPTDNTTTPHPTPAPPLTPVVNAPVSMPPPPKLTPSTSSNPPPVTPVTTQTSTPLSINQPPHAPLIYNSYTPITPMQTSLNKKKSTSVFVKPVDNDPLYFGMRKIADLVWCEWRDGTKKVAKIIDRHVHFQEGTDIVSHRTYYVHYLAFNRRMDEWVNEEKTESYDEMLTAAEQEDNDGGGEDGDDRPRKRVRLEVEETIHQIEPTHDEHEGMDEASIKEHEEVTKIKNINRIELGRYSMDTWYFSPFPKEYCPNGVTDIMYFCEFCLKYFIHRPELTRHYEICKLRHPPGNEIYRDGNIAMFEVDGGGSDKQHEYSQNLCYVAKLFLDHKTLYFDVDPFLFYVLCEISEKGYHLVGYYSKEKYSEQGYNLACILTLPCYQRKGYGSFLIDFSYTLSMKENKVGSPEKPLSDLGLVSYRSYWCNRIMDIVENITKSKRKQELSVWDLCKMTSITSDDVMNTMKFLGLIKFHNGSHVLLFSPENIKLALSKFKRIHTTRKIDVSKLHWAPLKLDTVKFDKWLINSKENEGDNPLVV